MELQRGDLIAVHTPFTKLSDIFPLLIRKITDCHWNHVAWVINPSTIIEAQANGGVKFTPLSTYDLNDTNKYMVLRFKRNIIDARHINQAIEYASSHIGQKYDWKLIFYLLKLYIFGKRKKISANDWENSWICSELIASPLYRACKFEFDNKIPVKNITPKDIVNSSFLETVS